MRNRLSDVFSEKRVGIKKKLHNFFTTLLVRIAKKKTREVFKIKLFCRYKYEIGGPWFSMSDLFKTTCIRSNYQAVVHHIAF